MTSSISEDLRATLRLWASGVSVVTTDTGTQRSGMTVSAFNSLSLDPPQILVCLYKAASVATLLPDSMVFAVNILDASHSGLSDRFAGRIPMDDRFEGLEVTTAVTGSPILKAALGWLDCKVVTMHDGGTHWIVVGEVLATEQRAENGQPLIYFNRGYWDLHGPQTAE